MSQQLNEFKSFQSELTTSNDVVYSAPANRTTVVLMAQVANITSSASNVTFIIRDNVNSVDTELVKEFAIAPNDASGLLTGKLVVEEGNELVATASDNSALKLTLSLLETLNES